MPERANAAGERLALRHLALCMGALPAAREERPRIAAGVLARVRELVSAALGARRSLEAVSVFVPDLQAWLRETPSRPGLLGAVGSGLERLAHEAAAHGANLRLAGDPAALPSGLELPPPPAASFRRTVLFFLGYGGQDEIRRATERALARGSRAVGEEEFSGLLDTAGLPDPDLLLFVGGALTPRDFLIWQASYAEIWHTPVPWDRFSTADLHRALEAFSFRNRRFGR